MPPCSCHIHHHNRRSIVDAASSSIIIITQRPHIQHVRVNRNVQSAPRSCQMSNVTMQVSCPIFLAEAKMSFRIRNNVVIPWKSYANPTIHSVLSKTTKSSCILDVVASAIPIYYLITRNIDFTPMTTIAMPMNVAVTFSA